MVIRKNTGRTNLRNLRQTVLQKLCCGAACVLLLNTCFFCATLQTRAQGQIVLPFYSNAKGGISLLFENVEVSRQDSSALNLQMRFSLVGIRQPAQYVTEIVPRLFTDKDSVDFPTVRLLGSSAYYHEVRSPYAPEASVMELRDRDAYKPQAYAKQVSYSDWMTKARLKFVVRTFDGCGSERSYAEQNQYLPQQAQQVVPVMPVQTGHYEVVNTQKTEQLRGCAYVSFRVNRTEIDSAYQNNPHELERIRHSIDSLLQQKGVVMTHLTLKGYASPEGSYEQNVKLASGRVHSLKQFIIDTYGLDRDIISVDYEPEDWQGLRQYVEASQLTHRAEVLALIDSDLHPDTKLRQIAYRYPKDYRFLLDSVFVNLRHTDYCIDYVRMWEEQERSDFKPATEVVPVVTEAVSDSVLVLPKTIEPIEPTERRLRRYKPLLAVKTNMLFDLALTPNIELEVPLGRQGKWSRWSIMGEYWFPWWRLNHNKEGDVNPYLRSDQRPTKTSYEMLTGGLELRYWFAPRCNGSRPWLTGTFVGFYAAGGMYDFEWKSEGSQGEFISAGISVGHSWVLSRHWNLELSAAAGYIYTPYRYYEGEFDDTHLIYRYSSTKHLFLPTKLKVSIVYILGKKGGMR